jgi:glycerol uptake facilitator protein
MRDVSAHSASRRALPQLELGRRLLAELVGTALLVIFGAGALVAALEVGQGKLDYAGLGVVGFSFASVIAAVVYMFGSTSSRYRSRP